MNSIISVIISIIAIISAHIKPNALKLIGLCFTPQIYNNLKHTSAKD